MADTLTGIGFENKLNSVSLDGEVSLRTPLPIQKGVLSIEGYSGTTFHTGNNNRLQLLLSGGDERYQDPSYRETCDYLWSSARWGRNLSESSSLWIGPELSIIDTAEAETEDGQTNSYSDRLVQTGFSANYNLDRLRLAASSRSTYSTGDNNWESFDFRLRARDKIKSREIPVIAGALRFIGISSLQGETSLRYKARIENPDAQIVDGNFSAAWNLLDDKVILTAGLYSSLRFDGETHFTKSPSVGVVWQPSENVTISFNAFLGEAYYSTPY